MSVIEEHQESETWMNGKPTNVAKLALENLIGGVMVSVLAWCAVYRGFESRSQYEGERAKTGWFRIRVGRHVYPRTVVSVREHYKKSNEACWSGTKRTSFTYSLTQYTLHSNTIGKQFPTQQTIIEYWWIILRHLFASHSTPAGIIRPVASAWALTCFIKYLYG